MRILLPLVLISTAVNVAAGELLGNSVWESTRAAQTSIEYAAQRKQQTATPAPACNCAPTPPAVPAMSSTERAQKWRETIDKFGGGR